MSTRGEGIQARRPLEMFGGDIRLSRMQMHHPADLPGAGQTRIEVKRAFYQRDGGGRVVVLDGGAPKYAGRRGQHLGVVGRQTQRPVSEAGDLLWLVGSLAFQGPIPPPPLIAPAAPAAFPPPPGR